MELAQKVKDDALANQPLIGSLEPIDVLEKEYAGGQGVDGFVAKAKWLRDVGGFSGLRRTRGDGDCFYRSFAFAFIQRLLHFNDRPMHHFIMKHIEDTKSLLKQAGFDETVYLDFYGPFHDLLVRMHTTDPHVSELNDADLQRAFNDPETSNSIVVYLRLLTSAFLKLNEDDFLPFLFTLEDDSAAVFEGKPPNMATFCANHVEAIGKEADHVQIAALSRCLKVSLDVAYLSQNGAPPETPLAEEFEELHSAEGAAASNSGSASISASGGLEVPGSEAAQMRRARDDPSKCDIVHFEIPGAVAHIDIGTLLFRPGHYDVLVSAPPPASPEVVIPRAGQQGKQ
ncbi:cysteine proteinase [Jaminaea rosea]|uniref:ubiquitinyl hydrolase 1 n=1 Tax=Jaminaea rosea TaxID=1569628 RepID=A0A316UM33_9BASI|nr:cysteine proteinase [Jaminaea rosea]PWN26317.1 cysteine proteinase [Jaminaea rosea]